MAIKQWRALPEIERERYKANVDRIRVLVAEVGGARASGYIDGVDHEAPIGEAVGVRPRAEAVAELRAQTTDLLAALATPAGAIAKSGVPRSARLTGKVAYKGLRRAARRHSR